MMTNASSFEKRENQSYQFLNFRNALYALHQKYVMNAGGVLGNFHLLTLTQFWRQLRRQVIIWIHLLSRQPIDVNPFWRQIFWRQPFCSQPFWRQLVTQNRSVIKASTKAHRIQINILTSTNSVKWLTSKFH